MNKQIQTLLKKVQYGELSEIEAIKQYLLDLAKTGITSDRKDGSYYSEKIEESTSSLDNSIYDTKKIECINNIQNPEYRLFIFLPFGFGNETLSWSWKNAFDDQGKIEVWLVGASIRNWQQLVNHLIQNMKPLCEIPFVVYGHSLGGIIAYEVLVQLKQRYQISPIIFVPSSVPPPAIFERFKMLPPVNEIDNTMDIRSCREILERSQVILPLKSGIKPLSEEVIRCELELIKTYHHKYNKQTLTCSILALQANNDVLVKDPVSISLWKNYTQGHFEFQEVEGTHLYFMNPPKTFFKRIKSFLQKENSKKNQFTSKTYRLISFRTGTEEVHTYPYGINPKGYLIYQQDGKMAAHIWGSSKNFHDHANIPGSDLAVEKLLTYLSYTGDYREDKGVIEHSIYASTDPSFDKDCLTRYYQIDGKKITLTTAPFTTKYAQQSKSGIYSELVWEQVKEGQNTAHWIVGSWLLSSYKEEGHQILGEFPTGLILFTQEGFFSMVATKQNRSRPYYDNLILASHEELLDANCSSRSCCGRYEVIGEDGLILNVDEGLFNPEAKDITILLTSSQQRLRLDCAWDNRNKSVISCALQRTEY